MAKGSMKKSKVRARSQRSIDLENEKLAQQKAEEEALVAKKQKQKHQAHVTFQLMLGIYSLLLAVISWLADWMGIIALASIIVGVFGMIKLKDNKDRYYWFSVAAIGLGGVRFIWEMVTVIMYLMK